MPNKLVLVLNGLSKSEPETPITISRTNLDLNKVPYESNAILQAKENETQQTFTLDLAS